MNIFELLPWQGIAEHLRGRAEASSGVEGAIIGAGFGAATALASIGRSGNDDPFKKIATGVALGVAFGAADNRLLRDWQGE